MKINLKKKGLVLTAVGLMLLASIGVSAQLAGASGADSGQDAPTPAAGVWGPNWNAVLPGNDDLLDVELRAGGLSGGRRMIKRPPPKHVSPIGP